MEKASNDNSNITVIIPTLNEERNIAEVIHKLNDIGYHKIFVIDANSIDRTVEITRKLGAYVTLQKGRGKGAALRQAFNSDSLDGDLIVMMDADGSMDAKEIPRFIEALESGADLVKGSRFLSFGYSEDMSLIRRIGNLLFVLLVNLFWSANYTDLCYGFGVFRRDALEKLCPCLESTNFEIEAEIFIKAKKLQLNVVEVPSIEYRRKCGKSNLSAFRDGVRILKTIIDEALDELVNRHEKKRVLSLGIYSVHVNRRD